MKLKYLFRLLLGNLRLWIYWVWKGEHHHAAAIAYDAGLFVRMYRNGTL